MWRYMLLVCALLAAGITQAEQDETWLHGKWELIYDPDGAAKDWLEFLPGGDAISSGPNGRIEGFYVTDGSQVKAVFTYRGKDFIMTFRVDRPGGKLRIVTSQTGRESVYAKLVDSRP